MLTPSPGHVAPGLTSSSSSPIALTRRSVSVRAVAGLLPGPGLHGWYLRRRQGGHFLLLQRDKGGRVGEAGQQVTERCRVGVIEPQCGREVADGAPPPGADLWLPDAEQTLGEPD